MLTNLLARQFGMVHELQIRVPEVGLCRGVALFGGGETLHQCLEATARAVNPKLRIYAAAQADPVDADFIVLVGPNANPHGGEKALSIWGVGWTAGAGSAVEEIGALADDPNPLGPYFAACLGAGEVFKSLWGLRSGKGRFIESTVVSLWTFEAFGSFADAPIGPPIAGTDLPPAYVVGVGAVGQAFVATIASCGARGHLTLIDPEEVDGPNSNRYLLVVSGERRAKVDVAADYLRSAGLSAFAFPGPWPNYAFELPHPAQRSELQQLEAEYKYEYVLSCVDKNVHRHAIQKFWPRILLGGSTDDLLVQVTGYDARGPFECLMCGNPVELQSRTIEGIADELRKLGTEERLRRYRAHGLDARAVEEYLRTRKCGEAGEQELNRFANRPEVPDFSVGFVSAASGVVLAAQFIKLALGGRSIAAAFPEERGHTLRFSFLFPEPDASRHLRRTDCSCSTAGRAAYDDLWRSVVDVS
jgi:molybdopterin/thiamine biosynthesis adenylyltransferase